MFTRPAPWLAESILHLGCQLEMNTTPIVHGQSRAASREWQWGVHMPLAFYLGSASFLFTHRSEGTVLPQKHLQVPAAQLSIHCDLACLVVSLLFVPPALHVAV
jgi:hypothetical protein